MRAWLREYYVTEHWKGLSARKRALSPKCEVCGQRPSTEVHHLHYETLGYELLSHLKAWCTPCHKTHHRFSSL